MKTRNILVLDFDNTICDSSSMDKWLPTIVNGDHTTWFKNVAAAKFRPVRGARAGVKALRKKYNPEFVIILTARSEVLRAPTTAWVKKHFPELTLVVSMRAVGTEYISNPISKGLRLEELRRWFQCRVIMVDDDRKMAAMLHEGDKFIHIKNKVWGKT